MDRPNVLFVVLDSVSAERLSSYGYERETTPAIDAFADGAVRYTRALANTSWTVPAHGTFFTGRYPSEHGANATHKRLDAAPNETLAGRLSAAGYRTVGLSTNPWVATDFGYDTGFDEFEDVRVPLPFEPDGPDAHPRRILSELGQDRWQGPRKYPRFAKWALGGNPVTRVANTLSFRRDPASYADADVLNNRLLGWLDDRDGDAPFFAFCNYMDAHEPYNPDPEWLDRYRDGDCDAKIAWHLRSIDETYDDSEVACINDRYDACLSYLDDRIGRLLAALDDRGLSEETLVVLTADHGKCLGEHGYMGVGTYLYDELLRVPLVVSPPAGGPLDALPGDPDSIDGVVTDRTDQIDIHDAILAAAGVAVERDRPDGVYAETLGPHQDVEVTSRTLPAEGLRRIDTDDGTLVVDTATGKTVALRAADEGAKKATGDGDSDRAPADEASLRERLDTHVDALDFAGETGAEGGMDADVQDQLEELGYL